MNSALFMGTPEFAAHILEKIIKHYPGLITTVITQPDKPTGRGGTISQSPVKQIANKYELKVIQPDRLRHELSNILPELNNLGPFDLGIVIAYGQILPTQILNLPIRGCINVHASLLPRWRGAAPIQRALMADDQKTGICLMQMDEGLDTGGILAQQELCITSNMNFQELHDQLMECAAYMLIKFMPQLLEGKITATPQTSEGVTYAPKITTNECRIQWNLTALEIHNLIRGLSPLPGAYTFFRGKRLKILAAEVFSDTEQGYNLAPGTLIEKEDIITVKCGTGTLRLLSVQIEGKNRMDIKQFSRGSRFNIGEILGTV